jgi:hypothetical protein
MQWKAYRWSYSTDIHVADLKLWVQIQAVSAWWRNPPFQVIPDASWSAAVWVWSPRAVLHLLGTGSVVTALAPAWTQHSDRWTHEGRYTALCNGALSYCKHTSRTWSGNRSNTSGRSFNVFVQPNHYLTSNTICSNNCWLTDLSGHRNKLQEIWKHDTGTLTFWLTEILAYGPNT